MATLGTVAKYITSARVLLQDTVDSPYRYSDGELITGLNIAILEARKLRPDLFLAEDFSLPEFTANDATAVPIDAQYRPAFLYYMIGHAQLRDDEPTQDNRAAALLGRFTSQLMTLT